MSSFLAMRPLQGHQESERCGQGAGGEPLPALVQSGSQGTFMLPIVLKHTKRKPKLRLSLVQNPGSSTRAQPRPHLLVWQGLGACCHPGRAPCGSPGQLASHPGVLEDQAARTIQGSDPSSFHSACPNKHCESPTGHSCWGRRGGGGAGGAEGSEVLTQPSYCTWLCLQPPPTHSWGKQCGRKQKGSHPLSPAKLHLCPMDPATCCPAE